MKKLLIVTVLLGLLPSARGADDVLVANFEGKDWGDWKATGDAFGVGPAGGALPNQMPVSGFLGKGLVNSYHGGDGTTGTLTSPSFQVERRYLNFLIGGGKHPGKTCMNLLIDGKAVRTATGPNDRPGGSEQLDWASWDVGQFIGTQATLQIVDEHTGGWGHINVDHIVQGDRRRGSEPVVRELAVTARYLHLPVQTGAAKRRMTLAVAGQTVREFEIELAEGEPDFWAFADVSAFRGKTLRIETTLPSGSKALDAVTHSDEVKGAEKVYAEKHRPQLHFTSRRGWLNDPNGLVYSDGEYHLFYQHNPYGHGWGNMHWGHAVSKDLLRWQEQSLALYPRRFGDWAFSGSAVVDANNTSGFGKKSAPLVAAYTSTGRGECIVYSNDRGRTWTEYDANPVVKHAGRDPRLLWHDASKQWVMAVYDEYQGKRWIAFHTSPDLKKWTFRSRIEGFYECPDLFELSVEGKDKVRKWVLYAADGNYVLGWFDGAEFKPEGGKQQLWYGNFYAAQTFSNTPDGRRIQLGWGRGIEFPGMPFNQQMTIPCQLTLRETTEGVRMFAEPVKELENLARRPDGVTSWSARRLKPGETLRHGLSSEPLDIRAEFGEVRADVVGVNVRGVPLVWDAKKQELRCKNVTAPLKAIGGSVRLRVLVDRGSVEVFGNEGAMALSVGVLVSTEDRSFEVFTRGGEIAVNKLEVIELRSAWGPP